MPVITCPDCGHHPVSDRAEACPNCGAPIAPRGTGHDARVKRALDHVGYKSYEILSDGDFKITLTLGESRSQVAFISSGTNKACGIEYRDVYSVAYKVPLPLDEEEANRLLRANRGLIVGSWGLSDRLSDGSVAVIYTTPVPADCTPEVLDGALGVVMRAADKYEHDRYGTDEY